VPYFQKDILQTAFSAILPTGKNILFGIATLRLRFHGFCSA